MSDYTAIANVLSKDKKIIITAHKSPDGDSIGSTLGFYHYLLKKGYDVKVLHPDRAAKYLEWMPGFKSILWFDEGKEQGANLLKEADVVFCLDYNAPKRVGDEMMVPLLESKAVKIMIDHHLYPDTFCDYIYSFPEVCSTSQLIIDLIVHLDGWDYFNEEIGTPLYAGLVTDTGSFRFPSVQPQTHLMVSELIKRGVIHSKVHELLFDTNTIDRLKLRGYALSQKLEVITPQNIAIVSLSAEELKQFNYQNGDTEGLVNMALSVEGIRAAVLFSQKDGKVKMSFRSKGDVFVNTIASENFEGGGHQYAAGGVSSLGLIETITKFKALVPKYF
jgi:phosphoesterase RecJ-like protein